MTRHYGENGYFYVSYYDLTFAAINPYGCNAVFTAENTNNYKNIYQYDPLGWTDSLGTGSTPTFWGANVFTATSNDPLKAVSFYTTDSNCNYNLYVGSSILTSRTLVQSGTIPMAGYHTIPLNSAIPLTTGQKFSVIVNLTTPNYNYPIALEEPLQYKGSNKAIANASESFYSSNGNTWYDMTSFLTNTNICIKAFTGSATLPIPTVTRISPASGSTTGGTLVTVTGTNLAGATKVNFGSNAATISFVSDTMINVTAPAGTGTVDVTVTTSGGTSATSSNDQYTYTSAPTVTALNPKSGSAAGGNSVIITGTGFTGVSAVKFGTNPAITYTVNSATQITATAPAGTGTVDVTVTSTGGTSATSSNDQYTYTSAPTITALNPTSGPVAGGNSVIITGTGFIGVSAVKFGTNPATTYTVNSATQITATAPAGTGTVDVTVTTPGGTSTTSNNDLYTFGSNPVTLSFNLQKVELHPNSSQNIQILMNKVPANGLAGFDITVYVADPAITNITAVSAPSWAGVSSTSPVPSSSVRITAANFNQVKAGDINVSFGNITITGIKNGTTNLIIVPTEIDDNNGGSINPDVTMCQVNVTLVKPFPGCTNSPLDLNGDGLYEDINGNGRLDFADVVTYFNNMAWITQNEPVTYFDYNRNGRIDFSDVVNLFNMKSS